MSIPKAVKKDVALTKPTHVGGRLKSNTPNLQLTNKGVVKNNPVTCNTKPLFVSVDF